MTLAEDLIADGWPPPPRLITALDELVELPHRSVVIDTKTGKAWQRNHFSWTASAGFRSSRELLAHAGALLLIYTPKGPDRG